MTGDALYLLLADLVLGLHLAVVLFVVGGALAILVGNLVGWGWVNRYGFRLAHLAAIGIVVVESWLGITCPLTSLEMWLRAQAHGVTYGGSFIGHWMQRLLYYEAPASVFMLAYSLFGLLMLVLWWRFPPVRRSAGKGEAPRSRQLPESPQTP